MPASRCYILSILLIAVAISITSGLGLYVVGELIVLHFEVGTIQSKYIIIVIREKLMC